MTDIASDVQRPAAALGAPYRPRPLRFIRREEVDGWRLKLYGISARRERPGDELLDATMTLARRVLPQPPVTDNRYGVGFATAHEGATFVMALIYWWQSENELHQRIYVSPGDDTSALTQTENQATGCVWELAIVDFERRAWIDDVLANPDGPDLERYLTRELNADV